MTQRMLLRLSRVFSNEPMELFHIIVVALIQGITEFLPVSSSGHLILIPHVTSWPDQGQVIDVAVHVGTLLAVTLYFRQDTLRALRGLGQLLHGKLASPEAFLALCLCIATVPVVLVGLGLKLSGLDLLLRDTVTLIGWSMLIFGIVLWWVDTRTPATRDAAQWTLKDALILGFWQAIALIPGTSRSGITITGARALGYDRESAARLAMLMSIPTILAAGTLETLSLIKSSDHVLALDGIIAAVLAFGSAMISLHVMMRLTRHINFTPYVIYRIFLGIALLVWSYGLA